MTRHNESWVDRQIREAQERGDFDGLRGAGKPLAFLDQPYDENWWIKGLMEREQLDATVLLPPQLVLRKEAEALPDRVLAEGTEEDVRALVEDFNERVRAFWRRPVDGPVVVVRTVDVEAMVARWRASHPPVVPAVTEVAGMPPASQRRWRLRSLLGRRSRR